MKTERQPGTASSSWMEYMIGARMIQSDLLRVPKVKVKKALHSSESSLETSGCTACQKACLLLS